MKTHGGIFMKVNSMDASIVKIGMANELKREVATKESEFNMQN